MFSSTLKIIARENRVKVSIEGSDASHCMILVRQLEDFLYAAKGKGACIILPEQKGERKVVEATMIFPSSWEVREYINDISNGGIDLKRA